jgi:hypothetical protein
VDRWRAELGKLAWRIPRQAVYHGPPCEATAAACAARREGSLPRSSPGLRRLLEPARSEDGRQAGHHHNGEKDQEDQVRTPNLFRKLQGPRAPRCDRELMRDGGNDRRYCDSRAYRRVSYGLDKAQIVSPTSSVGPSYRKDPALSLHSYRRHIGRSRAQIAAGEGASGRCPGRRLPPV